MYFSSDKLSHQLYFTNYHQLFKEKSKKNEITKFLCLCLFFMLSASSLVSSQLSAVTLLDKTGNREREEEKENEKRPMRSNFGI